MAQRNVPVFAPFSTTNKKLGYCQVRRNADEKISCHRLTFAEWLATQEVTPGEARKAFVPILDVSHGLNCGSGLTGRNINPRSMVQEDNERNQTRKTCFRALVEHPSFITGTRAEPAVPARPSTRPWNLPVLLAACVVVLISVDFHLLQDRHCLFASLSSEFKKCSDKR
ncbi:MAG: hypothetical protein CYPHOPRED_002422 [Cyphobasidiales sp. Tagirdzhanova-0007]|nr:MAG: hypothetical protein CYPHOPRED_002422 [Cyphobasidiales sp. Tagirdzhanova-0007]